MLKKVIQAMIMLFGLSLSAFSQDNNSKISGSVKLKDGHNADGFTISLLNPSDSSIAKTVVTEKTGSYHLAGIGAGNYVLKISGTGYSTLYQRIEIKENDQRQLAIITLNPLHKTLEEVTVISKKPFIENKIDKTVVNVEASPTSNGLTALEVLEKSPGVTVDNDGNISVKGKSGVIILIDGKSTYLSGQDLTNYLKNLSANQLDQIEIMTQPSAKYDASGNSGLINFKTKKNRSKGLNGSVNATMIFANYFKNTYSLNLNYKKNKVNVFGNFGYSNWQGFNELSLQRSFRTDAKTNLSRYYNQSTYGKFSSYPFNGKFGLDYNLSSRLIAGFIITKDFGEQHFNASGNNLIYDSMHNAAGYNYSASNSKDPYNNSGINLNMKYNSKSGDEISADGDYLSYQPTSYQTSYNYLYDANNQLSEAPYLLHGFNPTTINIKSFKADYSRTLKNKVKIESGVKSSWVTTDNDAQYTYYDSTQGNWLKDNNRSNHFIYKENINAAYLNLQKQFNKWGVQVGVRGEQTIAQGHQQINNSDFKKNYFKIFPTTYISYKINDSNTIAVSFGRRIERPGYRDLNPFQQILDRYTYQQGNPLLQPQFSNNAELSYNYKGIFNIAFNYTTTHGIINDVLVSEKSGNNYTTYVTKDNIASRKNTGIAISFNKPISKMWSTNIFFNVYNNQYKGLVDNEFIDVSYTSFNTNISNQFTFKKGWSAELNGFLNYKNLVSSVILAQPMGMFSLGGAKQILHSKGTIKINLRDPLWLMRFKGYTAMDKYTQAIQSVWDNRRLVMSFSYRFGKSGNQTSKRRTSSEDEQSRVGGSNTN